MSKVMIYAEIKGGKIKKTAFELASEGRKLADALGGDLGAVLIGPQAEQFAPDVARYGADSVYVVEAPELESYNSEYYAQALAHVIQEKKPEIFLLGHSMQGKDLAPRTAAKLGVATIADCVSFELDGGKLVGKRPMYAGNALPDGLQRGHRKWLPHVPTFWKPRRTPKRGASRRFHLAWTQRVQPTSPRN